MNKKQFKAKVMAQLELAEQNKADKRNVLDLRLYVNDCMAGVYDMKDLDELYDYLSKFKNWFIDIYENIYGENRAEFADFVIWSDDFSPSYGELAALTELFEGQVKKQGITFEDEEAKQECYSDFVSQYEQGNMNPQIRLM